MRLAQYGLAVVQVDTLALKHDKFDANRERIGTLWLVVDDRHVQLEHAKQLDQLYDDAEWQRIHREELDSRLRYRRAELRQDEAIERAELSLQNSERMQAIRAREIDLYGRIVDSKSRKQAVERGAGDMLAELEHELAKKDAARGDESSDWAHLRHLAQIRMRTEARNLAAGSARSAPDGAAALLAPAAAAADREQGRAGDADRGRDRASAPNWSGCTPTSRRRPNASSKSRPRNTRPSGSRWR